MKIAFQGVSGAYSEAAGRRLFGARCRMLPQATFESVFAAVNNGDADRGVIPIENSLAGSIHQNYDLLVQRGLHITDETYLHIEHALLVQPSARWADLREVRSHPQALAQCSHFFAAHPHIRPVMWFDTAGAAQSLSTGQSKEIAAIAGENAGKLYGLKILRRRLQNHAVNFTRFLAVARKPRSKPKPPLKTSITFIPRRNQAGALFRLLEIFAMANIDLAKIESRPDPENPFAYRFYLDFIGGALEPPMKSALDQLAGLTRDLRVLGSYPRAALPALRKGKT